MGNCWWCYWGWPKPIHDIYTRALELLDGDIMPLNYGPAHIVWEDENWDCAQWCLDNFDKYPSDYSAEHLAIVRRSLEELLLVDEKYKLEPEGYGGENPENFPPPSDWEMGK